MAEHVCPWWAGYFIDNRLRRLIHNPARILGPYVRPGMTTLDVGCGMGLFSLAMAQLVGPAGCVIAADLQPQMLRVLQQRAARAGLAGRIRPHKCEQTRLGVTTPCDFALAFAMLHEVPDLGRLLIEIHACLKPAGRLLLAEPRGHIRAAAFAHELDLAATAGLTPCERPAVRWCHAAVLARNPA
jgi:2-polyprenyl-3-methyl-5-hydroxy-6-metoxy-1,4-benzoquinol methylase